MNATTNKLARGENYSNPVGKLENEMERMTRPLGFGTSLSMLNYQPFVLFNLVCLLFLDSGFHTPTNLAQEN